MIKKTKDYSKFQKLKGNREPDVTHIRRLMKSITANNMLATNPIIVTKDFYVIDGQHRLSAAQQLDIDIYYAVSEEDLNLRDVVLLNDTNKRWLLEDFVDSYIKLGYEEYQTWKQFAKKYSLRLTTAATLLSMERESTVLPSYKSKLAKSGDFEIKDIDYSIEFVEKLKQVEPYCYTTTVFQNREFVRSVFSVINGEKYSWDDLIKYLSEYPEKLRKQYSRVDYLRQWEDVVKFSTRKRVRFY